MRPTSFWLGHRTEKLTGGHEFNDGCKPGGPNRQGLIGPRLSPDDRKAPIEFLKSM